MYKGTLRSTITDYDTEEFLATYISETKDEIKEVNIVSKYNALIKVLYVVLNVNTIAL